MTAEQWARLRKRLYLTLPYIPVLLVAHGVMSEDHAVLWVGLVSTLIAPAGGIIAAKHVDLAAARYVDDVSEALPEQADINRVPCHLLHGASELHVFGCEGWSYHSD